MCYRIMVLWMIPAQLTGKLKWNKTIIHLISYTCYFPAMSSQSVEKGL